MSDNKTGNDNQESASGETKQRLAGGFPTVNLEKAILMMKKVWDKEKRNAAPATAIMEHWDYAAKSSGGFQAIASLKRFGLLEEVSGAQVRSLKLSGWALDLLKYEGTDLAAYWKLVKEMALLPSWFEMLWKRYGAELPSDKTFETYLVFDIHMEQPQARLLMRTYKETISFAKLTESDTVEEANEKNVEEKGESKVVQMQAEPAVGSGVARGTLSVKKSMLAQYSIPIGASEATITFTGEKLAVEDFDALADYIAIFKKQFERKQKAEEAANVSSHIEAVFASGKEVKKETTPSIAKLAGLVK